FAAAYNAPIAGAVFALEIVLGNFAVDLFAPVVVASVAATLVTRRIGGFDHPIYEIPRFELRSLAEMPLYLVLGVLAGFVAVGFQAMLRRTSQFVRGIPASRMFTMTA